jgi:hypothetical protein
MITEDQFVLGFRYRGGSIQAPWRDIRKKLVGDCQDFSWTMLIIKAGGWFKALFMLLTFQAIIWRCWSPVNGIFPRHAVLSYRGQFIDSTYDTWRDNVEPCRRAWPVGTPILVGGLVAWQTGGLVLMFDLLRALLP